MHEQQLSINFEAAVAQASAHPEAADFGLLLRAFEQRLKSLKRDEKLRAAGDAIAKLAEIYYSRAEWLLGGWEERWSEDCPQEEEPILSEEMLSSFLRQTMSLNLDDLLDSFTQTRNRLPSEDSVAGEVEEQALLDWLEQEEKQQALAVAHDENISEWVALIHTYLIKQQPGRFSAIAADLQKQDSHLTPVAVWLALLLGGFRLKGGENFYSTDFWVTLPPSES